MTSNERAETEEKKKKERNSRLRKEEKGIMRVSKKTLRTKVFGIMEKIQIEVLVSFSFAMLCLWWKAYCTFWAAFCVRTLLGLGEKGKGGGGKERGRQRLMEPSSLILLLLPSQPDLLFFLLSHFRPLPLSAYSVTFPFAQRKRKFYVDKIQLFPETRNKLSPFLPSASEP